MAFKYVNELPLPAITACSLNLTSRFIKKLKPEHLPIIISRSAMMERVQDANKLLGFTR